MMMPLIMAHSPFYSTGDPFGPFQHRHQEDEAATLKQAPTTPLPVALPPRTPVTSNPMAVPPAVSPPMEQREPAPAPPPPPVAQAPPQQREPVSPLLPPPLSPPSLAPLHDSPVLTPLIQRDKTATAAAKSATAPSLTPPCCSGRAHHAPTHLGFNGTQGHGYSAFFTNYLHSACPPNSNFSYKARAVKDPDTLTYEEAMQSDNHSKWIELAQIEISALVKQGTWVEVPQSKAKIKILPGTWTSYHKRTPDSEIKRRPPRGEAEHFCPSRCLADHSSVSHLVNDPQLEDHDS